MYLADKELTGKKKCHNNNYIFYYNTYIYNVELVYNWFKICNNNVYYMIQKKMKV